MPPEASTPEPFDPKQLLQVLNAVKNGDFSVRMPEDRTGLAGKIADTLNEIVELQEMVAREFTRVSNAVGKEGKISQRAHIAGAKGGWGTKVGAMNELIADLVQPVNETARVIGAVARGDLTQSMTLAIEGRTLEGEFLHTARVVNGMVEQLGSFASEVTRVAREVGTEGKLGGQAMVKDVAGTWKDLTDSVNSMASNLTAQVRNIAEVTTAVASGDLSKKITVDVRGEFLQLKDTINTMMNQLRGFASEVTRVAREVGTEGRLGGQASVPGAAGLWKDLTSNVNQLAGNLTTQVRAIAEVSTAVTAGDLTRSITVDAAGEVASLKDNLNQMIGKLRTTTRLNTEQDWLKTKLAKLTRMLQGQRDPFMVAKQALSEAAPLVGAQHGVFYLVEAEGGEVVLKLLASYAFNERKSSTNRLRLSEGLVGQCAAEKERILLTNVPGDYVQIQSGLGGAAPLNLVVLPVIFEGQLRAVIELASFNRFTDIHLSFLDQLTEGIGIVLNTIGATMRTEELLKQSQTLAEELQSQQEELTETNKQLEAQARSLRQSEMLLTKKQEELQQANEELEERTGLLTQQKAEVENKNHEVEEAGLKLQAKAEQLALTSKYKSEFLANMSHELRTPLNSLLILSKLLCDEAEGTLTAKQKEFARTIHSSGGDLLELINEILDLAKIESGTMRVEVDAVTLSDVRSFAERAFHHVAEAKGLQFEVEIDPRVPRSIRTDWKRLQQLLKNLLSNAFKFTAKGRVSLAVRVATGGWSNENQILARARTVLAFSVQDTGIGIPKDKHAIIFEAFQQADGGTSRKYGGTGLGLSISREIVRLLGGEIHLESAPGEGSTFTFYLPATYAAAPRKAPGPSVRPSEPVSPASKSGPRAEAVPLLPSPHEPETGVPDDRDTLRSGDRVLLIVEDDTNFAKILLDLARQRGFKGVVAVRGDRALELARRLKPAAVTLDLRLPDRDGWAVLDCLKHDPATRHIPVQIISVESEWQRGLKLGALAHLQKPATKEGLEEVLDRIMHFIERPMKSLLIVEDQPVQRQSMVDLIADKDIEITAVATGAEAMDAIRNRNFDCMVLDLTLPDVSGFELIEMIKRELGERSLPFVVHTGRDLTRKEETELRRVAEAVIVKDARSPERLLEETALFLHRVEVDLPDTKQRLLRKAHQQDPVLSGRKVLIVDDDVRNVFALTAVLEQHNMRVSYAESGKEALAALEKDSDVDVVLMDVMMPEADGYETTRAIRRKKRFEKLPILAVTAKAMKGDREKCIASGASDYITKPVDVEQLLSLLRVWLHRQDGER